MSADTARLTDKILSAFDHACDDGDVELAEELFRTYQLALTREGGEGRVDRRQNVADISRASDRLTELKQAVGKS